MKSIFDSSGVIAVTPPNINSIDLIFSSEQILRGGAKAIWLTSDSKPSAGDVRIVRNLCASHHATCLVDIELIEKHGVSPKRCISVAKKNHFAAPARTTFKNQIALNSEKDAFDAPIIELYRKTACLFISDLRHDPSSDAIKRYQIAFQTLDRICYFVRGDTSQVNTYGQAGATLIGLSEELFFAPSPSIAVKSYIAGLDGLAGSKSASPKNEAVFL